MIHPLAKPSGADTLFASPALVAVAEAFSSVRPVAALYVAAEGAYSRLPGVDTWHQQRDARLYSGPYPVVAHPPCQRWGKFAAGSPLVIARTGQRKHVGDDGGTFLAALRSVRRYGGLLEHPWGSRAWRAYQLHVPSRAGGWIKADEFGGWTCCVEQGRYGHYARKPTLLLAYFCELPELRWGVSEPVFDPALVERVGIAKARKIGELALRGGGIDSAPRIGTPDEFRDLLLSIARTAKPPSDAAPAFVAAAEPHAGYGTGWRGAYWERRSRERSERTRDRAARRAERSEAQAQAARSLEDASLDSHGDSIPALLEGVPTCEGQVGIKVTRYPDGLRVVAYQSRGRLAGRSSSGSASTAEELSEPAREASDKQRSDASLSRSRALVVHRARCLGAFAMWTFTKRGKFADVNDLWEVWKVFCRGMKRAHGSFRYVAVPEMHSDGTWHLHVLVDRYYPARRLRLFWHRALTGDRSLRTVITGEASPGNVDAKGLWDERNGFRTRRGGPRRAALYVAKYVGKGFGGGCSGRRLFSVSAGLHAPVEKRRVSYDAGLYQGFDLARRWVCEAFGVEWFPAKFVRNPLWGFAVSDVLIDNGGKRQ